MGDDGYTVRIYGNEQSVLGGAGVSSYEINKSAKL